MARYWSLGLIDIYSAAGLLVFALYALRADVTLSPWLVIIGVVGATSARIYSNVALRAAHEITTDQIATVIRLHSDDLKHRVGEVLREQGLRAF